MRDSAGGSIITIAPGEQWVVVLTDNTTAAGTWSTFQLGATVSVANAAALAGAGLKAITSTLNQRIDSTTEAATPFNVVDSDRANCVIYTGGAGTANLPNPATVGNDWFFMLRNSGSGTLNVVPPSGTIDGGASINLDPNVSCFIFTDGTNFFTVGLSSGSTIAFDFVSIAIPGSGDFVLSGANLNRISYRFTGALTGNRRVVVPNTTQQYWVDNQTTGAFTLSVSTAAQVTPPEISQGNSIILYCDGTDVINAVSQSAVVFPVTIGQGGTNANNAADARTNLSAAFSGININTQANSGLANGGDLTADRNLLLDVNNLATVVPDGADFLAFEDVSAANVTVKATIADIIGAVSALPSGNQFGTIYISTAPNTYSASDALQVDPATSVTAQYNGTDVLQTRPLATVQEQDSFGRASILDGNGDWASIPAVRVFRKTSNTVLTNVMTNDADLTTALSVGDYMIQVWMWVQNTGASSVTDYEITLDWTGPLNDNAGIVAYGQDGPGSLAENGRVGTINFSNGAVAGIPFNPVVSTVRSSLIRLDGYFNVGGAGTLSVRHRRSNNTEPLTARVDSRMLVQRVQF